MGIESIKSMIDFILLLVDKMEDALRDDQKVSFAEALAMIPAIAVKVPGLLKAVPEVPKEFVDLDANELAQLREHIKVKLDLDDDRAEALIERIIDVILVNYNAYIEIKALA